MACCLPLLPLKQPPGRVTQGTQRQEPLCSFTTMAVTAATADTGLTQQTFTLSPFWSHKSKSKMPRGPAHPPPPNQGPGQGCALSSSPTFGGSGWQHWCSLAPGSFTPISAPTVAWPSSPPSPPAGLLLCDSSPLPGRTPVTGGSGPSLLPRDPRLPSASAVTLLPGKVTFSGSGKDMKFGRTRSNQAQGSRLSPGNRLCPHLVSAEL